MKSFKCTQSMNDNLETCDKQQMQKGRSNFIVTGRIIVLNYKKENSIHIYSSSYFVYLKRNLSGFSVIFNSLKMLLSLHKY